MRECGFSLTRILPNYGDMLSDIETNLRQAIESQTVLEFSNV